MSNFLANQRHLVRRFVTSLSRASPPSSDIAWVNENLLPSELELWLRMKSYDQRHSIEVARRFDDLCPVGTRDHVAAALLHDIGKIEADLGVFGRVLATIVGPRGQKLRRYHEHELIGLRLCRTAGSSAETLRVLDWSTQEFRNDFIVNLLREADQI
ncbi:MAG: hypothetical protein O3B91_06990 [Actinomycetota bacterium]|nr:hypothetical protein [Actinomycetota bacterium]MDA3020144.1 hypothetical protein [Actinomycetota bacterium]